VRVSITRTDSHDEEQAAADDERGGDEIDGGHDGPSRSGRSDVDDGHKRPAVAKRIRRGLHWVGSTGSTSSGTTGFDVVGS
jgi:hypothetical protein